MAASERPSTPPRRAAAAKPPSPITPEQVRRMEAARLRSKALSRAHQDASLQNASAERANKGNYLTRAASTSTSTPAAGQKRPYAAVINRDQPATQRDARQPPSTRDATAPNSNNGLAHHPADAGLIRAARKFQKFVEYDLSKMRDTKGGFMSAEDDPHNRALHASSASSGPLSRLENAGPAAAGPKPRNLTLEEWERQQLHRRLREQRAGPYEPGISILDDGDHPSSSHRGLATGKTTTAAAAAKRCRECGSREIDWQWEEVLRCAVCAACKDKFPEKYSLLTKTEAKQDYLLTDPELKDEALLPRLEKPNPHKASWNNMMLYLRFQVEEYAFSAQKWGSAEKLDEEFEKRTKEAKERKEKKFRSKLDELKKRTRVDAYKRARGGGGGEFGDTIGKGRHEHEWGRVVEDPETGMTKKSCVECGMEVEELEF